MVILIQRICDRGLRTRTPCVSALIGFLEKKIGILDTHSGSCSPFAETMKIFCKEIDLVLTLMEYPCVKFVIA